MVKKIIDEHHARITLGNRTEINGRVVGAQITLVFPVVRQAAQTGANSAAASGESPPTKANDDSQTMPSEEKVRNIGGSPS